MGAGVAPVAAKSLRGGAKAWKIRLNVTGAGREFSFPGMQGTTADVMRPC
jgi:hypothetical protein